MPCLHMWHYVPGYMGPFVIAQCNFPAIRLTVGTSAAHLAATTHRFPSGPDTHP